MGTVISTATTNFDKLLVTLIQKRLEEELRAPLPHLLPGNFIKGEFVAGTNNTMRFLRAADMPVVTGTPTPGVQPWLTEGTPPAVTEDLSIGFEEYSAFQAGRVIKLTDKAMLQSPINMLALAAEKVARNAVETADQYVADVLGAGTQVIYAGSKSARVNLANTDVVTGALIRRGAAILKASAVPAFSDGYYRCIINPAVTFDIQSDTAVGGWLDANRYAGSMPLFTGEIGRFAGVRFIESPKAKVFANAGTTSTGGNITGVAATDILTSATNHGLAVNDQVQFPTLTGGAGLTAGATTYFVIAGSLTSTTFQVAATLGGAAVKLTTDVTAGTLVKKNHVYSTALFGPGAYAFGDWGSIESHITPPGGQADPLHQLALVGWKGYFGARLLEAAGPRYVRVESGSGL